MARTFAAALKARHHIVRSRSPAVPNDEDQRVLAAALTEFLTGLAHAEAVGALDDGALDDVRRIAGEGLFWSRFWSDAYHLPPGNAKVIDGLYDLEGARFDDPTEEANTNGCNYLMQQLPCVGALWERRHSIDAFLEKQLLARGGAMKFLDYAGGRARYVLDLMGRVKVSPHLHATIVDVDPAALASCEKRFRAWKDQFELVRASPRRPPPSVLASRYDVIVSAGLFDYLRQDDARRLIEELAGCLHPHGTMILTNYTGDDQSRMAHKLVRWDLIYRDEAQVKALFPAHMQVTTYRSANGCLIFAEASLA
jgi:hypothetical protein